MTSQDPDAGPLCLLRRTRADSLLVRVVALLPGTERVFDQREWRDTLVEVQDGQLILELCNGQRLSFSSGQVLWLEGLPIRSLHNRGGEPVVLVAASRRHLE